MAKGSSGLGSSSGVGSNSVGAVKTVIPPTPQQVAAGNVLPQGGVAFSDFMAMDDDEKAQVIADALAVGTPMFLDDSGIQKFAYFTGMSDKPTVVSDAQLDQTKGTELFRTVNDTYNPRTDIGYTSSDIIEQVSTGDFTMYSDSGGSAHGKAIYFAGNYDDSAVYGGSSRQHPQMMRAKITGGKSISENALDSAYSKALQSGNKVALACNKADSSSGRNLYALASGYSVITPSYGSYYMVLNRGCLTVSNKTQSNPSYGKGW